MTGRTGTGKGRGMIEERRDRVARLWLQKRSVREIAEILSAPDSPFRPVSKSAIGRDVTEIKKTWKYRIAKTGEEFLSETAAELDEISRRLWGQFFQTPATDGGVRMAILNSLSAIPAKKIRLGQSLGIIEKAPEEVAISVDFAEAFQDLIVQTNARMSVKSAREWNRAMEAVLVEDKKLAERLVVDLGSSR